MLALPEISSCFESQGELSVFLPGNRLWDGLRAHRDLDTLFPLLPPWVGKNVVVLRV